MKIVTLLGSPRTSGISTTIANRLTTTAANLGAKTKTFELNRLTYRGCQGCYACKTTLDHCVLDDDLAEVLRAAGEADVLVLATPVFYGDVTGQLKCFIDRTFSWLKPDYVGNPQPSRLTPGKTLVVVMSQGNPDEQLFADVYPRYAKFFTWLGFTESRLVRACGFGPATTDAAPEAVLLKAEETAREIWADNNEVIT
jgi:multimeric flavodoxin WrbA